MCECEDDDAGECGCAGGLAPWPEITGLHVVLQHLRSEKETPFMLALLHKDDPQQAMRNMVYRGKVKLHGCNAGVHLRATETGSVEILPQSRTRVLSVNNDNAGFCNFALSKTEFFKAALPKAKEVFPDAQEITIFGEWCGPGIQKGVAVSAIGKKIWALFSLELHLPKETMLVTDPAQIQSCLPGLPKDVYLLPWHTSAECGESVTLDLTDDEQMQSQTAKINDLVACIDHDDPWVAATFGVHGTGEGVVWYPVSLVDERGLMTTKQFGGLSFKTKGVHHAMVVRPGKQHAPAQVNAEVASSIAEFAAMFVSEARCQQGIGEACGGTATKAKTRQFVLWISNDVKKESATELAASKLTWEKVDKAVATAARDWFLKHAK
eukprot:TRINITY_DN2997_c1_g1_i1.p1 TRINITY_DN2997_c1_g1~~TRINITY_DN2997_c1_g1_i1.p1  ORF type:complete len:380 (-),score=117.26 TRINITY_DN2997_c1_g1_i1:97-1236(-)